MQLAREDMDARFVQPFHRAARLLDVGPPAAQVPAKLFGADEILDGRDIFRGIIPIQMVQQQIETARIEMGMIPGEKKVAGAISMAHHIKCQPRSLRGV